MRVARVINMLASTAGDPWLISQAGNSTAPALLAEVDPQLHVPRSCAPVVHRLEDFQRCLLICDRDLNDGDSLKQPVDEIRQRRPLQLLREELLDVLVPRPEVGDRLVAHGQCRRLIVKEGLRAVAAISTSRSKLHRPTRLEATNSRTSTLLLLRSVGLQMQEVNEEKRERSQGAAAHRPGRVSHRGIRHDRAEKVGAVRQSLLALVGLIPGFEEAPCRFYPPAM